jgi:hypothetical protein
MPFAQECVEPSTSTCDALTLTLTVRNESGRNQNRLCQMYSTFTHCVSLTCPTSGRLYFCCCEWPLTSRLKLLTRRDGLTSRYVASILGTVGPGGLRPGAGTPRSGRAVNTPVSYLRYATLLPLTTTNKKTPPKFPTRPPQAILLLQIIKLEYSAQ